MFKSSEIVGSGSFPLKALDINLAFSLNGEWHTNIITKDDYTEPTGK